MAPIFELIFILMMIAFAYYLTRHRLGYFRTHERLGEVGSDPPPPAVSKTNGRIVPREAEFESFLRDLTKAYLRF